jgi:RNA polymerase sigma factor (sigma-70 family)
MSTGADHPTDGDELVRRASAGDRDALAILVKRARIEGAREAQGQLVRVIRPGIQEHIRTYLVRRYRPSIVASWLEDLTQDAVVRVLFTLTDLQDELWPWALAIARSTASKRVRAEIAMRRLQDALRALSEGSDDPPEEPAVPPEQEALTVYLRRACKIVAAELEGAQRQAFVLRLEGVPPREIARTLGLDPKSVYTWKRRHQRMVVARCNELSAKDREP